VAEVDAVLEAASRHGHQPRGRRFLQRRTLRDCHPGAGKFFDETLHGSVTLGKQHHRGARLGPGSQISHRAHGVAAIGVNLFRGDSHCPCELILKFGV
jgi:hypothetical protein